MSSNLAFYIAQADAAAEDARVATLPDPSRNDWDHGHFVSACIYCGRDMNRLPGLPWRVSPRLKP